MRNVGVLLLVLACLGCPQETAVWLDADATVERLTFRMSHKRGGTRAPYVGRLLVARCGSYYSQDEVRDAAMWDIGAVEGGGEISSAVYGVMPPGFEPWAGAPDTALTLTPGCYDVDIGGSPGWTRFHVDSNGQVSEDSLADRWGRR